MPRQLPGLLILLTLTVAGCARSLTLSFEIPKDEIQKSLEGKFPLETTSSDQGNTPFQLTLTDPVVLLEEGKDQIGLRVNVVAKPVVPTIPLVPIPAPPLPEPITPRFTGSATLFATVSYDPNKKAIVLSNPKVTSLTVDRLPSQLSDPLSLLLEKVLAEKFADQPIPLKGNSTLDRAVQSSLKSVAVKNGKVIVEIGL